MKKQSIVTRIVDIIIGIFALLLSVAWSIATSLIGIIAIAIIVFVIFIVTSLGSSPQKPTEIPTSTINPWPTLESFLPVNISISFNFGNKEYRSDEDEIPSNLDRNQKDTAKLFFQGDDLIVESGTTHVSLGSIHVIYPPKIVEGQENRIVLSLFPNDQILLGDTDDVPDEFESIIKSPFLIRVSPFTKIAPEVYAELEGVDKLKYKIISSSNKPISIQSSSSIEWVWLVTPISTDDFLLALTIHVPVIDNDKLIDKYMRIWIEQKSNIISTTTPIPTITPSPTPTLTATPTFTPTPIPLLERISSDEIYKGVIAIIVAIIGLIGVITAAKIGSTKNQEGNGKKQLAKNSPKPIAKKKQ